MQLSVVIITFNEEANLGRTLASVAPLVRDGRGEIIVLDSGSTDRTVEIARQHGAKVFIEPWKGFSAQKNSALEKASGDWILSLDADEEVEPVLLAEIAKSMQGPSELHEWCLTGKLQSLGQEQIRQKLSDVPSAYYCRRKNYFLGRWIKHGGFWPDPKLRLFLRGTAQFESRAVHEDARTTGRTSVIAAGTLLHHSYPALSDYIEHMNRYSSLAAEMAGPRGFSVINIVLRPLATFIYNYFFRLGFLDGREGMLLHLYHAVYVSWKYAKAWELRKSSQESGVGSQQKML
ncbi:MAG TPA: glycosyltransferase family 2 protein [Terriglobales bacterium]|nr:glycosyltransferase family 2 protein [Terriglobales bacterium]